MNRRPTSPKKIAKRERERELRMREWLASLATVTTPVKSDDGEPRVRCKRHGKIVYRTTELAHAARIACIKSGTYDPGLSIFGCGLTHGYHLGHPGGWKSLQRIGELSGGQPHA